MEIYQNDCVGCETCKGCGMNHHKNITCDFCGEEVYETYEGKDYCRDCYDMLVPIEIEKFICVDDFSEENILVNGGVARMVVVKGKLKRNILLKTVESEKPIDEELSFLFEYEYSDEKGITDGGFVYEDFLEVDSLTFENIKEKMIEYAEGLF